jgi:hypothetical protein
MGQRPKSTPRWDSPALKGRAKGHRRGLGHGPPHVPQGYFAPSGLAHEDKGGAADPGLLAWAVLDRPFGACIAGSN